MDYTVLVASWGGIGFFKNQVYGLSKYIIYRAGSSKSELAKISE